MSVQHTILLNAILRNSALKLKHHFLKTKLFLQGLFKQAVLLSYNTAVISFKNIRTMNFL